MLKNYLKIAWRNLIKNKAYSLLNIGGLAMGMTVAMLIGLWIYDEFSYNKYHSNADRVARVLQNQTFNGGEVQTWSAQALQLGPELRNSYGASFKYITMATFNQEYSLLYNKKALTKGGMFMEPEASEMLMLDMVNGTRAGLTELNSILLSESTAKAFFGNEDPMNKIMQIDEFPEVKVNGVYKDLPRNSTFGEVDFIASWELYKKSLPEGLNWGNSGWQTMVQIADHADMAEVSSLIKNVKLNRVNEEEGKRYKPELFLHPMTDWYLYENFKQGVNAGGRIQYVRLFGIIGVFVLILACINFMNLSTARSEKRAKEIGVRKAIGSDRSRLIYQFFTESVLVAVLAFIVSLLGVQLILPYFNEVADKQISILWLNPLFWLLGLSFALLTGILAGSYPSLYLSSFRTISVLKGVFRAGRMAALPRKVMVVVQFTVSIILIIGTIIVFQQIQFVKNRPVGYNQNNLVTVLIKNEEIHKHYEVFRNDLFQTGVVEEVAKSETPVTQTFITNGGLEWKGKDPGMQDEFVTLRISHEFGKTIGWKIKAGRDFSKDFETDSMAFIINESAARYMDLEDPVGEKVRWGNNGTYTIIGVVEDMITQSPYDMSKQTFFIINYKDSDFANIKLKANTNVSESIPKIEAVVKKYDPVNPFEYSFTDLEYAKNFGNEERIGKLASFFAILAIFISCLGLFGLASFVAEQRTKEIGIRKVLGASVTSVWGMLSRDFMALVILSCLLAAPIAYYFLDGWLKQYAYRTQISYWVFVTAAASALLITVLTISFHAIKAATANPVKSLRSE
jgi:putative ABC transport system permease protein